MAELAVASKDDRGDAVGPQVGLQPGGIVGREPRRLDSESRPLWWRSRAENLRKTRLPQHPAKRLLGVRNAMVLNQNLRQINRALAHNAVSSWLGTLLHHSSQRLALDGVQARALAEHRGIDQVVGSVTVEG